jgi:hypothetical protein
MDLIKKKSIALTEATHTRLMEVVGFLQAKRGTNTTANQALEVLLDNWETIRERPEANQPGVLEQIFQNAEQ